MRTDWEPAKLLGAWPLVEGDWKLIANKTGVTRLGFALLPKFYETEGRFPAHPEKVPTVAVDYMSSLVKVDPALFATYSRRSRTIEYHRAQISVSIDSRLTFPGHRLDQRQHWVLGGVTSGAAVLSYGCR